MRNVVDRGVSPYDSQGERKYLNQAERQRVIEAFARLEREKALYALTLAWTGARVSEVLDLRAHAFELDECWVAIRTLKRRHLVVREVPLPRTLMDDLERHFGLREKQRNPELAAARLWTFCRVTAWRFMRRAMRGAGVVGVAGCPRGLRHAFAVGALQAGVPLHLVQRWLGHARMSTTSTYANVSGTEEREFAARFWRAARPRMNGMPWMARVRSMWSRLSRLLVGVLRLEIDRGPRPS
jgi:integrase